MWSHFWGEIDEAVLLPVAVFQEKPMGTVVDVVDIVHSAQLAFLFLLNVQQTVLSTNAC